MAILRVTQAVEGTATFDGRGNSRTAVYHVHTDTYDDFPDNVVVASDPNGGPSIPTLNAVDPRNSYRLVREKTPSFDIRVDEGGVNAFRFKVDVKYDTRSTFAGINADSLSFEPDPLLRLPDVQWSFIKKPRVADFALEKLDVSTGTWSTGTWTTFVEAGVTKRLYTGTPLINSAGQPFDPPPLTNDITIVGVLERFELEWNGVQALQYMQNDGAINEDYWGPFAPGMARIENITAPRVLESGRLMYRVRYEVHIQEHWYDVIPDVGFGKIVDGKLVQIVDDSGIPLGGPVRLNGAGLPLDDQQNDPTFYHVWNRHQRLPFAPLNLL